MLADFDFRMATERDAPELALLYERFFNEAGYQNRGIRYSVERSRDWLTRVISAFRVPHVVATFKDTIVGVISYELDDTFCVEPVAIMHTIYVAPEHRRSAIGRILVTFMDDLAKRDGACALHAPISGEMPEQTSLLNLFARAGYTPLGAIVGRSL